MNSVNASFLDSVCAFFLAEAGRIACECLRKRLLVDKAADHGMLGGSDQVEILALDLIHHGFHLGKAHNAVNDGTSDHERRNAVGKALVDHEISRIGKYCGMKSCNISLQIIETVAGNTACRVEVDACEAVHDICMIRDFEIRDKRLSETLKLDIFGIVLTDRDRRINDIRDYHHILLDDFEGLLLNLIKLCQALCIRGNLFLQGHCLFFLSLGHHCADLF